MRLFATFGIISCLSATAATNPPQVTFSKDVAPILAKNCQGCHRPGEAAPMSFLTYQQARPWAKAIKEAVLLKKMPPWFADPHYWQVPQRPLAGAEGHRHAGLLGRRARRKAIRRTCRSRSTFVDGWNIGQPDMVLEMPAAFDVPASGTIEYQYVIIPTKFTEDRWVQMAEVRPGNRAVVHHVIAFIREPKSKWMRDHAARRRSSCRRRTATERRRSQRYAR